MDLSPNLAIAMLAPVNLAVKGKRVGKGLTSEVFEYGGDQVLKLFVDGYPMSRAQQEFTIARALWAAGLPVPAAHALTEVDGRWGIVFEQIDGASMLQSVERKPWTLFACARQLAEIQARIHVFPAPAELPSQRSQFQAWLKAAGDLSPAEKHAAESSLKNFPEGTRVCHGDFHPANILSSPRGPIIIDWSMGTRGHPLVDVARTAHLMRHADLPEDSPAHLRLLLKIARSLLHRTYLRRYLQTTAASASELNLYLPAQLAASSAWRCGQF